MSKVTIMYLKIQSIQNIPKAPHSVFAVTLCRRQMRELQSQGIQPLSLSCKHLVKMRTMWSTVDLLQAPLDVRIKGLFVWLR